MNIAPTLVIAAAVAAVAVSFLVLACRLEIAERWYRARRAVWLWFDNLEWWWRMYPQQGRLRRAVGDVQAARECVERLDDTAIGAVRVYPSERAISDALAALVAAETRLADLMDWED